jgi:hypothetical protein
MARIRSVKPDLRTSQVVASWPFPVRYAFVLLWGYLDDKGRGLDIPKRIAGDCFPHDDSVTASKMDDWLDRMTRGLDGAEGPVCRYEADGTRYLHTINSAEHQRPNRPTPSRLPACPLHEGLTEPLPEDPHGNSVPGSRGVVVRGIGGGGSEPPPPRCPRHMNDDNPGPCGPCKDFRIARERWDAEQPNVDQARKAAIRACRLCDGDGARFEHGRRIVASPYQPCDHRPLRSVS